MDICIARPLIMVQFPSRKRRYANELGNKRLPWLSQIDRDPDRKVNINGVEEYLYHSKTAKTALESWLDRNEYDCYVWSEQNSRLAMQQSIPYTTSLTPYPLHPAVRPTPFKNVQPAPPHVIR